MKNKKIAVIDLGSNSFHMLISQINTDGSVTEVYKGKSKVQLRSGLTDSMDLTHESKQRALECLKHFSLSLKHYHVSTIKAVGTYTLRKARQNIKKFLAESEQILGVKIDVISGAEEARLVYVGAAKSILNKNMKTLVIDIGGGSTEIIIGKSKNIRLKQSFEVGCVGIQNKFFKDGVMSFDKFSKAITYVQSIISPVIQEYIEEGWDVALGSSGTIFSISDLLLYQQKSDGSITKSLLGKLIAELILKQFVSEISFKGLRADRENVLAGGVCILYALFNELNLKSLKKSQGALREGVLLESIEKDSL